MGLRDREPMPPRMRFNRWKIWAIVAMFVIGVMWLVAIKADGSPLPW